MANPRNYPHNWRAHVSTTKPLANDRPPRAGLFWRMTMTDERGGDQIAKGDGGREVDWFETTDGAGYAKQ
jgi:hypothetical protein